MCKPWHLQSIAPHGENDLSLMEFLMTITADVPKRCPAVRFYKYSRCSTKFLCHSGLWGRKCITSPNVLTWRCPIYHCRGSSSSSFSLFESRNGYLGLDASKRYYVQPSILAINRLPLYFQVKRFRF